MDWIGNPPNMWVRAIALLRIARIDLGHRVAPMRRSAAGNQIVLAMFRRTASARLDELLAAKAKARPVFVDGDGAHRIESSFLQFVPPGVAVEIALVFLRRSLGISEPDGGVAFGAGSNPGRERVNFSLSGDECEGKANLRERCEA